MATIWFAILAVMLGMYIVLDGFDFGVGAQYLWVARKDKERRAVLNAIGPLWDGNEVWLITSGGVLFFAFPLLYASAFSGLYLALFMVLWLLILRGLAIELRHHVHHHLWGEFWDVIFSAASLGLALLFGVALGNLLRGVPLNEQGYFFVALWTNLRPYADPQGILDWFTVMIGLLAVATLIMHGGNFLAFKVGQPVESRAARTASLAYWPVVALTVAAVVITPLIQPLVVQRYATHPIGFILPFVGLAALAYVGIAQRRGKALHAFIASGGYILFMIVSAAYGIYPYLLIATSDPANSLTIENAAAAPFGLRVGLIWFTFGAILFLGYTVYVYRAFWGKVEPAAVGEGY